MQLLTQKHPAIKNSINPAGTASTPLREVILKYIRIVILILGLTIPPIPLNLIADFVPDYFNRQFYLQEVNVRTAITTMVILLTNLTTPLWASEIISQSQRDIQSLEVSQKHLQALSHGESEEEAGALRVHSQAHKRFLMESSRRWANEPGFQKELEKSLSLSPRDNKEINQAQKMEQLYPKPQTSQEESESESFSPFNACYMQGSDFFPGWGYKKDRMVYKCGEELSREWINSYWQNESNTFTITESQKFVLDFSLALRLAKLLPGLKFGNKFQMDVGGSFRFVVRVEFTKSITLKTSSQVMHGTERVWAKLYEAKKPWPWQDPDFQYVGNTYREYHGPTGTSVITDAQEAELKLDSNQEQLSSIQEGEIVVIDGKRYQMGYELIPWETEVLGYREGTRSQTYAACHTHKAHFVKDQLDEIQNVIGKIDVEDTDLHHFWNDKEILYRQGSFRFNYKVILKRHWYNQRIREKFRIYRKNLDSWFPRWEKIEGIKEVEREWNLATLTKSASKGSNQSCSN